MTSSLTINYVANFNRAQQSVLRNQVIMSAAETIIRRLLSCKFSLNPSATLNFSKIPANH